MSEVIRVEDLGKEYVLGGAEKSGQNFREMLVGALKAPFSKLSHLAGTGETLERFWALNDVSFSVNHGEIVGVIGRNGAGKSTLLKILSRITHPTRGRVTTRGRVASLLEVGTGFHPELTGRENIFLNGAILGMSRKEITRKFDEIVAFAEVEQFLDTPVKRYSSGMYVRLAFSVAAHLEPEILLVDEVLAVGDAAFQRKCLGKMEDVAHTGRTVLFVSHNMAAMNKICERGILLKSGSLVSDGSIDSVINAYMEYEHQSHSGKGVWQIDDENVVHDAFVIENLTVSNEQGHAIETVSNIERIKITLNYSLKTPLPGFRVVIQLLKATGEVVLTSTDQEFRVDDSLLAGMLYSQCEIPGKLLNSGRYIIKVWAGISGLQPVLKPIEVGSFDVITTGVIDGVDYSSQWAGVICPPLKWTVKKTQ